MLSIICILFPSQKIGLKTYHYKPPGISPIRIRVLSTGKNGVFTNGTEIYVCILAVRNCSKQNRYPMSKNQIASCPSCGGRIPFKKFVQLNNFSVTNCVDCNARIEISNRTANGIIAGVSGIISAASIFLGAYYGEKNYQSLWGGLFTGLCIAAFIIFCICNYAYRHSELNRVHLE